MLVGTGIDLVEIRRIEQSIERYGDRFLQRVFTSGEIAYCRRKKQSGESFAARFAAKEAAAKALGTGIQYGVHWLELEVVRPEGERPTLLLHGKAAEKGRELGVERIWLAITHGGGVAVATVHMEGGSEGRPRPGAGRRAGGSAAFP
jgi:holo-[acyl-carrier protein] synthase